MGRYPKLPRAACGHNIIPQTTPQKYQPAAAEHRSPPAPIDPLPASHHRTHDT
ncbi:MAG: hypothetical protein O0X96_08105 [Methanocorpusculum sp.]|nr:hypothetical protein [Methanocorpusculum sp.]